MCPRATTAEHGGAVMASAHSFGEEEYIDLDLSSCGEYEFRVRRSRPEEMLLCRGRLHKVAPRPGTTGKPADAEATAAGGVGRSSRSTATVAPLQQHSHVRGAQPAARTRAEGSGSGRRRKAAVHAKLQASRAFFRSLFARTSCSDERCHDGGIGVPSSTGSCGATATATVVCGTKKTLRSSIEQEKLMDQEEEHAAASVRQRKSFSGVIRWQPLTAPAPTAPPPVSTSTTRRRNSCCGSVPAAAAALKRSSTSSCCRSESEGLIQGAIAYCKRSQQQQQQRVLLARKSVSDAALSSSSCC